MKISIFQILLLLGLSIEAQNDSLDSEVCNLNKCFCDNDLTPAGVMISHVHDKNEWMMSYRFMQMNMNGNQMGIKNIDTKTILKEYTSAPQIMQMNMHMLMLMFGLNDKITIMGMMDYNSNYMEMQMKMGDLVHPHSMKTAGIGDTKINALYAVIKNESSQLILSTGINLPTGTYNLKGSALDMMYPSSRLPYNMQLGKGTFDFLPGLTYMHKKDKFVISSQLNSTVRFINNRLAYRYGNDFNLNTWCAYNWLPFISNSIRIEGIQSAIIKSSDQSLNKLSEPGSNSINYGGHYLNMYLGTVIQFKKSTLNKFRVSVEYGLPVYQNVNGIQMTTKNSLIINTTLTF